MRETSPWEANPGCFVQEMHDARKVRFNHGDPIRLSKPSGPQPCHFKVDQERLAANEQTILDVAAHERLVEFKDEAAHEVGKELCDPYLRTSRLLVCLCYLRTILPEN